MSQAPNAPADPRTGSAAPFSLRTTAPLLAPALVYLAAVAVLGDWIVDDAGISYAYAKNIALGHGFVSGPGRPPVEGYSNFLWVLVLVPFRALRLFDPVVVPKILGAALVLWALFTIQRTLERQSGRWEPGFFAALWIGCAPPIVIWTSSGLENGLMLLLVAGLWAAAVERGRHWQARCGLLAALAAMTHPEGLVYVAFAIGACAASARIPADGRAVDRARDSARSVALCLGGFLLLFAPFLVFRLTVFGRPWPQTYYAKRAHASFAAQIADLARHPAHALGRVGEVGRAFAGETGPWILAAALVAALMLAWTGRLRRPVALAAWLLVVAVAAFVAVGPDWMGEHRFATGPIAALAITLGGLLFATGWTRDPESRSRDRSAFAVAAALSVVLFGGAGPRILRFAVDPTVPYRDVQHRVAERFAAYAETLGVANPSILVQDAGAVLDLGRLRVYDVTGLVDPEATRTLRGTAAEWRTDHPEFYDWVFETIRPTFIASRGFWSAIPAYERDPRFVRDYAAIESYVEGDIVRHHQLALHSGDYVRRDVVQGEGALEALRAGHRADPQPPASGWRLVDAWRRLSRSAPPLERLRDDARIVEADGKDFDRAAALYATMLERAPNDEGALMGLALSLDRAGRAYEARPVWIRRLDLERAKGSAADARLVEAIAGRLGDPRHRLPLSTAARVQWMRIGRRALLEERDHDAAIRLFREVLEVDPSHDEATHRLAAALTAGARLRVTGTGP